MVSGVDRRGIRGFSAIKPVRMIGNQEFGSAFRLTTPLSKQQFRTEFVINQ
uniref:Uncharacterized protein n=1 Tax=Rhizophagus irregularis (strain DAOM 181602 / DAOM 197198 / MUCL 43194) TaxID=747089 RepID=U9TLF5_RHIID